MLRNFRQNPGGKSGKARPVLRGLPDRLRIFQVSKFCPMMNAAEENNEVFRKWWEEWLIAIARRDAMPAPDQIPCHEPKAEGSSQHEKAA